MDLAGSDDAVPEPAQEPGIGPDPVALEPSGPGAGPGRGRRAWLIVTALLVVLVLAVAAVVITRSSGDDTAVASPPLTLVPRPTYAEAAMAGQIEQAQYELRGPLPDLGSSATVYRLDTTPVTAEQVVHWASVLGLESTPEQVGTSWTVAEGDEELWVDAQSDGSPTSMGYYTARSTSFAVPSSPDAPDTPPVTGMDQSSYPPVREVPTALPTDAEAEQIARDTLTDLGVLDGEWSFESMDGAVSFGSVGCAIGGGEDEVVSCAQPGTSTSNEQVLSRTVTATRLIDGAPVSQNFWNVSIGDGGVVESLNGTLATISAVGDYPLATQAAFDSLVDGTATTTSGGAVAIGGPIPDDPTTSVTGDLTGGTGYDTPDLPPPTFPDTTVPDTTIPTDTDGTGVATTTVTTDPGATTPGSAVDPGTTDTSYPTPMHTTVDVMPTDVPYSNVLAITGAELTFGEIQGVEDGEIVSYLVPAYAFLGYYAGNGSLDLPQESSLLVAVVALDPLSFTFDATVDDEPRSVMTSSDGSVVEPMPYPPETAVPAPAPGSTPGSAGPGGPDEAVDPVAPATAPQTTTTIG